MSVQLETILAREIAERSRQRFYEGGFLLAVAIVLVAMIVM